MTPATATLLAAALLSGAADDDRLPAPLDDAVRAYRMEVYRTFRQQRPEFDHRQSAGRKILADWKAAGGKAADARRVLAWLEAARLRSTPEQYGPLPMLPTFVRPAPGTPQRATRPAPPERPAPGPGTPRPAAPQPAAPQPVEVPPAAPPAPVVRPPVVTPPIVAPPSVPPPVVGPPVVRPPVDLRPHAGTSPVDPRPPVAVTVPKAPAVPANPWPALPPAPPVPEQPDDQPDRAVVNLVELNARIEGHNRALAEMESRLLLNEDWSAHGLAEAVTELDTLAMIARNASLYVRLVDETDRPNLPRLARSELAQRLIAERVASVRDSLASAERPSEVQVELAILATLIRKLQELARPLPN